MEHPYRLAEDKPESDFERQKKSVDEAVAKLENISQRSNAWIDTGIYWAVIAIVHVLYICTNVIRDEIRELRKRGM